MAIRLISFPARLARPRNLVAVVACIAATASLVVAVTPVEDPDVWWVAAAGRAMIATGSVPKENVFSFVEPSHPWLMHEWLFGPPYALALARLGPAAFVAIALSTLWLALSLLAAGTIARARQPAAGLAMMLMAVAFFGGRFLSARPTGVALLFPLALTLVAFAPRFQLRSVVAVTLLELAWANAHGSFPLGIVLLAVAAAERADDRPARLVAVATASLSTLVNPYGLALHRFVWAYFRGGEGVYRSINTHIKEFGSFRQAWGYTVGPVDLVALLLVAALAASAAFRSRHRVRALFCLGLLALAVLHARHLELAGLLACVLLLPHLDDLVDRLDLPVSSSSPRTIALLVLAPALVVGTGGLIAVALRRAKAPMEWVAGGAPLGRSIDAIPDGARAFVPFPRAGLTIWSGWPRGIRVFFDSRNDCYSAETFAAFWQLETTGTAPAVRREVLRATGTDTALVPESHPMARFLATEADWTLTRSDGDWRLYRRAR